MDDWPRSVCRTLGVNLQPNCLFCVDPVEQHLNSSTKHERTKEHFVRLSLPVGRSSYCRPTFKIVYELLNHFLVLSGKVLLQEFIKSSNDVACGYKDKRRKLLNRQ